MACCDLLGQPGCPSPQANIAPYSVSSFSTPKRMRNGFKISFEPPNGTQEVTSGDLVEQKMKYLEVVFTAQRKFQGKWQPKLEAFDVALSRRFLRTPSQSPQPRHGPWQGVRINVAPPFTNCRTHPLLSVA